MPPISATPQGLAAQAPSMCNLIALRHSAGKLWASLRRCSEPSAACGAESLKGQHANGLRKAIHPSHPPPLKSGRRVLRPTSPASVHQLVLVFACRPSDIPPNVRGPVSTGCDGVGLTRSGNPPVEPEADPLSVNPEWARRRVSESP